MLVITVIVDKYGHCLGLVNDYNGVQVEQSSTLVSISAAKYIDRVLKTHGWNNPSPHEATSEYKAIPFSPEVVPSLYQEQGPLEDTQEHADLADKQGFSYRSLLGELMYAYVTCRPDIGYHVTTLSKFSTAPAAIHYTMLKNVARYLRRTRLWGLIYRRPSPHPSLPPSSTQLIPGRLICPTSQFQTNLASSLVLWTLLTPTIFAVAVQRLAMHSS